MEIQEYLAGNRMVDHRFGTQNWLSLKIPRKSQERKEVARQGMIHHARISGSKPYTLISKKKKAALTQFELS